MKNKMASLGDRMKKYESVSKYSMICRMPVIIRIDGKAFHTFTKNFNKPFDGVLSNSMIKTMKYLCENIQGCMFGYTQSDEITLVLVDYKTLNTAAWFDNEVQKMCSVSASAATAAFNKYFKEEVDLINKKSKSIILPHAIKKIISEYNLMFNDKNKLTDQLDKLISRYLEAVNKFTLFDSRVFNLPKEEVCNCFVWRQQDAIRNSIELYGRAYFGHKKLNKKNCNMIKEMLMSEYNVDWNNLPAKIKMGACCYRSNSKWIIDENIPIFTENRNYIEQHIFIDE